MDNKRSSSRLTYPLDTEQMWEMDRLERQGRLLTEVTDLFPPDITPKEGQVIADLACGSGEWAIQVARRYPHCQVIGVDLSERMTIYARYRAETQQITNVRFERADVHEPFAFAENSLDLIHARFLTGFQSTTDWPLFFAECFRVLRPGGIMYSTEFESLGQTSSTAISRINSLFIRFYQRRGQSFAETEGYLGVLAVQAQLLRAAGFVAVRQYMHVLDYSTGTSAHEPMAQNVVAGIPLIEQLFVREELISQEEYTLLSMQLLKELYLDNFSGIMPFQTAWGRKPFGFPM